MAIAFVGTSFYNQSTSSQAMTLGTGNQSGDLHLVAQWVKNITNDVAATPSGYTDIISQASGGHTYGKLSGKFLTGGDSSPSINGAGTALLGASVTLRGVRVGTVTDAVEAVNINLNSSATIISYAAATIATAGTMILLFGVYGTSGAGTLGTPTTLSGSAVKTVDTYTGSNMKAVLWSDLQTSAVSISAGNIPITSGSSNSNRSILVVIRPIVSSSVTISAIGDALLYQGETGVGLTGTGFGASQGVNGRFRVCAADDVNHASCVNQTITAWGNTAITATMSGLSTFSAFAQLYGFVVENGGTSNAAGFPIKREKRFRLNDLVYDGAALWTSKSSIYYRVTAVSVNGTVLLSGSSETTDGAGLLQTSYYTLTEGGEVADGDAVYVTLFKDDATLSNTRGTVVKYIPTYE